MELRLILTIATEPADTQPQKSKKVVPVQKGIELVRTSGNSEQHGAGQCLDEMDEDKRSEPNPAQEPEAGWGHRDPPRPQKKRRMLYTFDISSEH